MAGARVPLFKEPGLHDFLQRQLEERERLLAKKLDKDRGNHSIILISPSEKAYEITVSDAGALVVTLVADVPP
jgi:hypothetical protein